MKLRKNILYAQSGGSTPVINATACGVIDTARHYPQKIGKVFAAENGILGTLQENLIDTSALTNKELDGLFHTPSAAFGTCRHQLPDFEQDQSEYERLFTVFKAHDIGYFFYNGGNDSQDTAYKISQYSQIIGYPLVCIGLPKTIDNDILCTDNCPGFGSVAKYIALSIREASLDLKSMSNSSTKVFILEVMGRHAGWIAAAAGLAQQKKSEGPHLILFPEIPFDSAYFLQRVDDCVRKLGCASIVVSEGLKNKDGKFISEQGITDDFGHKQLGGVAPIIAQLVKTELGYKYHYAIADYLQRSARHIASLIDIEHAYAIGCGAVEASLAGQNGVMLTICRKPTKTYQWNIRTVPLVEVANKEKKVPRHFISKDGLHITPACRKYLEPLIQGEAYPPYSNGLPQYRQFKWKKIKKNCPAF